MAFITPYVTDKFTAYLGDVISTNLSFAIRLTDEYTGREPVGNINVMIKQGDIQAIKNLSGYYLFTDLNAGNYDVVITSDFYFPEQTAVDISSLDPKEPVVEMALKPTPACLFPANATLIRGVVKNTGPLINAQVRVIGKSIETITDERGEFVLCFKGIKKEDITIEIKKHGNTKTVHTTIEEGKTTSMGIITFP